VSEIALSQPKNLPVGPVGRHGIGLWGVGTLVVTEAALFSYLLFSYYYLGATAHVGWLQERAPDLKLALPNTLLLLASSGAAWFGERGVLRQRRARALIGHVVAGLGALAAIFLWTALDYFSPRRQLVVSAGVMYWHFVDIVWIFVFGTYYLTPYLGFGR
jgi:cytochrome c oxidase subunit 3